MRLIDADDILQDLADLRKSPWANPEGDDALMTVRRLTIKEALDAVRELVIEHAPTVEPEPARLLTVGDFDGSADVDRRGNLACWIEHRGDHTRDGWGVTNRAFLAGGCKTARCWTKRPEEGQMAGMAWEDGA